MTGSIRNQRHVTNQKIQLFNERAEKPCDSFYLVPANPSLSHLRRMLHDLDTLMNSIDDTEGLNSIYLDVRKNLEKLYKIKEKKKMQRSMKKYSE